MTRENLSIAFAVLALTISLVSFCSPKAEAAKAAEQLVEMDASEDGKSTLSFLVGSAKYEDDTATGEFVMMTEGWRMNVSGRIDRETCEKGSGPLILREHGRVANAHVWVKDSGTFGDTTAMILCAIIPKAKGNPFKRTAFTF